MADTALPPGWDSKYDPRSARYYFINHYTKVTTWEDPRLRYRSPAHVEHIPLQDLSNISRMSPLTTRSSNSSASNNKNTTLITTVMSKMQETSLSQAAADTDQSVSKISTMFPTVTEPHIRLLLKKYYNREAVVISALQVEKYPITTPGPFTTPPPARNLPPGTTHVPLHMTPPPGVRAVASRTGSPVARGSAFGSPLIGDNRTTNSPKPHHSPKMKLRYMKNIFPKVEETILLEVLGNNENNVQKASEALKEMGYEKRDMKITKSKSKTEARTVEEPKQAPPPRLLTLDEKKQIKGELQVKYKDIPERVIMMALESVDYIKVRACQILEIMVKEEESTPKSSLDSTPKKDDSKIERRSCTVELMKKSKSSLITPSPSVHFVASDKLEGKGRRAKEKKNTIRGPQQENQMIDSDNYKSSYLIQSSGPNSSLVKGSDNGMLLEDYVSWDGPDPTIREGHNAGLAKGPNQSLLMTRTYQPCGPNAENRKGPALGLAKGSIYTQLKKVVGGESRGK